MFNTRLLRPTDRCRRDRIVIDVDPDVERVVADACWTAGMAEDVEEILFIILFFGYHVVLYP